MKVFKNLLGLHALDAGTLSDRMFLPISAISVVRQQFNDFEPLTPLLAWQCYQLTAVIYSPPCYFKPIIPKVWLFSINISAQSGGTIAQSIYF